MGRRSLRPVVGVSVTHYAVTRERGERWDASLPMREQEKWDEHAAFMDRLAEGGFVLLGGPLGDEAKFLLIIAAESEQAIVAASRRIPGRGWACFASQRSSAGRSCLAASGRVCVGRL
jgi:hypothetical protein